MGNDAKKKNQQTIIDTSNSLIQSGMSGLPDVQKKMGTFSDAAMGNYTNATANDTADRANIMGNYNDLYKTVKSTAPTQFGWDNVSYNRPAELGEAFGDLRTAGAGYKDFADTGGYSAKDIQELRARGMAPITSAYGGAIRDIDRANTLGGGASNYIAARSRAQRELPQQIADAETGVNAQLAEDIRSGKLQGLAGLSGVGSTMGGLSADEAGKILQANLANSSGRLQAAGMTEQAKQAQIANLLGISQGENSLYGTTPGMSSMFGNQVLSGLSNQANTGLGLVSTGMQGLMGPQANQGTPWWQTALKVAGTVAPYVAMAASDRNLKEDISEPLDSKSVVKGLKKLNLHKWKYKGDSTTHVGPMAQDFKKAFGVGDGKNIHLADVMGVMLAASKEMAHA
jgi:hypothetical protein